MTKDCYNCRKKGILRWGKCMFNEAKRIKIHFMYWVIMLSLFAITLLAVLLIGHQKTVTTLSNASLLLSIVLAVVAILITLWDVAGQKNNIADLQGMVRGFRKIIKDFDKISEENGIAINELKDIILELNERVVLYESKFAQIENLINTSDESTKITKELQELMNKNKEIRNFLAHNHKLPLNIITVDLIELLKMEFIGREYFTFKEFYNLLRNHYTITASRAKAILKGLIENKVIEEKSPTGKDDGVDLYKLIKQ